jgi:hypothetical protein
MGSIARNAIRAGADAVVIADDYAGNDSPFFSPVVLKEFVLPRLQRMVPKRVLRFVLPRLKACEILQVHPPPPLAVSRAIKEGRRPREQVYA